MDMLQLRIEEANRRYTDATWRLKLENQRTTENVKWIIAYSRQIQAYQERLRETNEASRERTEKLHLVYKNIELHGQIQIIREGLKRAMELTSRAEKRVEKVSKELDRMSEERLEVGLEGRKTRNKQFAVNGSPCSGRKAPLETTKQLYQNAKYQECLILRRKLDNVYLRLEITGEKLADLEMRKQALIQEIDKYKAKKQDILKAKINKETLHSPTLKLYCVELGAI